MQTYELGYERVDKTNLLGSMFQKCSQFQELEWLLERVNDYKSLSDGLSLKEQRKFLLVGIDSLLVDFQMYDLSAGRTYMRGGYDG